MFGKSKTKQSDLVSSQVQQAHDDNKAAVDKLAMLCAAILAPTPAPKLLPSPRSARLSRH